MGNKEAFEKLYDLHFFILEDITFAYQEIYDFLKHRNFELYQKYYIFFWEAVRSYKMDSDISFSRHLKVSLINDLGESLLAEFGVAPSLLATQETIESLINNKKHVERTLKHKVKLINCLKSMTSKQLQAIYFKMYKNMRVDEIANRIGISEDCTSVRLELAYKKIRDLYHGIRTKKKNKVFLKEKIYKIYELK